MGENTPLWDWVATAEDRDTLLQVEQLRELNEKRVKEHDIPKVVHIIWLGPREFPESSKPYIASWIRNNPGYTFKFWTDRHRQAPHPKMEVIQFDHYPFPMFENEYASSDNWAERSDLLRYEILYQHGGVYVDHDVLSTQGIVSLCDNYDFFCALEPPHAPITSTSITVCNNVIATVEAHPIIRETMEKVKERWARIEKTYPGKDRESIIYRVGHRTFAAFDEAVREFGDQPRYKNGLLPAGYFNPIGSHDGVFGSHKYVGAWYQEIDPFEDLVRKQLTKMAKKTNKTLLLASISVLFNLMLGGFLVYALRRKTT